MITFITEQHPHAAGFISATVAHKWTAKPCYHYSPIHILTKHTLLAKPAVTEQKIWRFDDSLIRNSKKPSMFSFCHFFFFLLVYMINNRLVLSQRKYVKIKCRFLISRMLLLVALQLARTLNLTTWSTVTHLQGGWPIHLPGRYDSSLLAEREGGSASWQYSAVWFCFHSAQVWPVWKDPAPGRC